MLVLGKGVEKINTENAPVSIDQGAITIVRAVRRRRVNPRIAVSFGAIGVGLATIAACSQVDAGTAVPNSVQAEQYQAEVTSSSVAASSSKAAEVALDRAISTCLEGTKRSKDDVAVFNSFIVAGNNGDSDVEQTRRAAVTSSKATADWLDGAAGGLPPRLGQLFSDLARNLRTSAEVVNRNHSAEEINSISKAGNLIRDQIGDECRSL